MDVTTFLNPSLLLATAALALVGIGYLATQAQPAAEPIPVRVRDSVSNRHAR